MTSSPITIEIPIRIVGRFFGQNRYGHDLNSPYLGHPSQILPLKRIGIFESQGILKKGFKGYKELSNLNQLESETTPTDHHTLAIQGFALSMKAGRFFIL